MFALLPLPFIQYFLRRVNIDPIKVQIDMDNSVKRELENQSVALQERPQ
jgi:hypothetical protein